MQMRKMSMTEREKDAKTGRGDRAGSDPGKDRPENAPQPTQEGSLSVHRHHILSLSSSHLNEEIPTKREMLKQAIRIDDKKNRDESERRATKNGQNAAKSKKSNHENNSDVCPICEANFQPEKVDLTSDRM